MGSQVLLGNEPRSLWTGRGRGLRGAFVVADGANWLGRGVLAVPAWGGLAFGGGGDFLQFEAPFSLAPDRKQLCYGISFF